MGNQPDAITRFYGNGQLFQRNDFRANIGIPRPIIPIPRAMIALADFYHIDHANIMPEETSMRRWCSQLVSS